MALGAGTVRITAQGHLVPSNTPLRIYNVHFTSTVTNTNVVLGNSRGDNTTTAGALAFLTVVADESIAGNWDGEMSFTKGVFVQTSTGFKYGTVTYETEH